MLVRCGFAAQLAAPPPGITETLNEYLQSAQEALFRDYSVFQTERFYTWTMAAGERFYDVDDNDEQDAATPCTKVIDPFKVTFAGIQHNGRMRPLVQGIPPVLLQDPDLSGWPQRYEIRQCIEVWPAPSEEMLLVLKGHFGLLPFTDDAHTTTIDAEAVFLLATANYKAFKGQQDANIIARQLQNRIGSLVAGSHHTSRYIPGHRAELAAIPPRFLPVDP